MKTVAYIEDRAVGVAALLPLACRDIVFKKTARMGEIRQIIVGRNNRLQDLSEAQVQVLTKKVAFLAGKKGHNEAVARAMVDPETEIVEARDLQTGATRLMLREEVDADRGRFQGVEVRKKPGMNLVLTGDEAASFGLGQVVNSEEDLKGLVRSAWQANPGGRPWLGRFAGHGLDRSLRELAAALRRPVHAGD